jgi:hypothetical protein
MKGIAMEKPFSLYLFRRLSFGVLVVLLAACGGSTNKVSSTAPDMPTAISPAGLHNA